MVHNVEAISQSVLIVGSCKRITDTLNMGFSDVGWFAFSEVVQVRALRLMQHLSFSCVCMIDDGSLATNEIIKFKQNTQGMVFVLSENQSQDSRRHLYHHGVNHIFDIKVNAFEILNVIKALQQQYLIQSTPILPAKSTSEWHFCFQNRVLRINETVISSLSYNEAKILKMLLDNCNETLSRERLMMALGRFKPDPDDRTLDRLICSLRKKFKKICPKTQFILSLYGHGYVFSDAQTYQQY